MEKDVIDISQHPYVIGKIFNKQHLMNIPKNLVFERFFDNEINIKRNSSKTVEITRWGFMDEMDKIDPVRTPADPMTLTSESLTASVSYFGGWAIIGQDLLDTHEDAKILDTYEDRMEESSDRTMDSLHREELLQANNVYAMNISESSGDDLVDSWDGITWNSVDGFLDNTAVNTVVQNMDNNRAQRFTKIIVGNDKVATSPVGAAYIMVGPIEARNSFYGMTDFQPTKEYPEPSKAMEFEHGALRDTRVMLSQNINSVGTGANGKPVYPFFILGENSTSSIKLASMKDIATYVYPPGKHGDFLHQRYVIGKKFVHKSKITNDSWLAVVFAEVA